MVVLLEAERGDAMRELIRPGLFWVVRIGLLLSVVAWIYGQSKTVGIAVNVFSVHCTRDAWTIIRWPFPRSPFGNKIRFVRLSPASSDDYGAIPHGAIPHWLIVANFAVYYGVLRWVYRKRGREAVGDV